MKLTTTSIVLGTLLLLAPWLVFCVVIYSGNGYIPMLLIYSLLLFACIFWKAPKSLQVNYWVGVASIPFIVLYTVSPAIIWAAERSLSDEIDHPSPFLNLPFAKRYSPVYNQDVLYRVDKAQKKVIFTPRSEYFWEYHKDDGIADKIRSFQVMPIQERHHNEDDK